MDIENKLSTGTLSAIGSANQTQRPILFVFTDGSAYLSWWTLSGDDEARDNAQNYHRTVVEITDETVTTTGRPAVDDPDLGDLLWDMSEGRPQLLNADVGVSEIASTYVTALFNKHAPAELTSLPA